MRPQSPHVPFVSLALPFFQSEICDLQTLTFDATCEHKQTTCKPIWQFVDDWGFVLAWLAGKELSSKDFLNIDDLNGNLERSLWFALIKTRLFYFAGIVAEPFLSFPSAFCLATVSFCIPHFPRSEGINSMQCGSNGKRSSDSCVCCLIKQTKFIISKQVNCPFTPLTCLRTSLFRIKTIFDISAM